jgi:hypothetical protein
MNSKKRGRAEKKVEEKNLRKVEEEKAKNREEKKAKKGRSCPETGRKQEIF